MNVPTIFIGSAKKDDGLRKELENHLGPFQRSLFLGEILGNRTVVPGTEFTEVLKDLNACDIILLLVSVDFCNDYQAIITQAMTRDKEGNVLVIPVLLRDVNWKAEAFGKLPVLPRDERPIYRATGRRRDQAWSQVVNDIHERWSTSKFASSEEEQDGYLVDGQHADLIEVKKTLLTPHPSPVGSAIPPEPVLPTIGVGNVPRQPRMLVLKRTLKGHQGPVSSVAFSQDGQVLVSDSWDHTIKTWNWDTERPPDTFRDHTGAVYHVIFSADERQLVSGSDDKTVKIWNRAHPRRRPQRLTGHTGPVSSVANGPDKNFLISASDDKTIIIWNVRKRKPLYILAEHTKRVSSIILSSDMRTLASSSFDGTVKLWDTSTGKVLNTFTPVGSNCPIYSITANSDMSMIICGNDNGTITAWDTVSTTAMYTLYDPTYGHTEPVSSVALSPDGQALASGSYDKTIKIWDLEAGQLLETEPPKEHIREVMSVAWHPSGKFVASGGLGDEIRIWSTSLQPKKAALVPPVPPKRSQVMDLTKWFDFNFYKSPQNRVFLLGGIVSDILSAVLIYIWLLNIPIFLLLLIIIPILRILCAGMLSWIFTQISASILALFWVCAAYALLNIVHWDLSILILPFFIVSWTFHSLLYASKKFAPTK